MRHLMAPMKAFLSPSFMLRHSTRTAGERQELPVAVVFRSALAKLACAPTPASDLCGMTPASMPALASSSVIIGKPCDLNVERSTSSTASLLGTAAAQVVAALQSATDATENRMARGFRFCSVLCRGKYRHDSEATLRFLYASSPSSSLLGDV